MTCITVIENNEAFQVKVDYHLGWDGIIVQSVWSVDQTERLYGETTHFENHKYAKDFKHEYGKRQAREIVKRYLRYK